MNKLKNITTIIFDLGGVIVDLDRDRCIESFSKLGVKNIDSILGTTHQQGFILDFEIGNIDLAEFRNEVRKLTKQNISDKDIDDAWNSLLVSIPPAKLELLKKLKKDYRVIMLSNTNELSFELCRDKLFTDNGASIDDFFHKCYLSFQMKMCKPNKDIFQKLLNEENIEASEALFLDDGKRNIEAAMEIGLNVRFVEPYSHLDINDFYI